MKTHHILGLSGGKDSAALAIYMREQHPELDIQYFFTDTGEELPEVYEFFGRLEGLLGKKIINLNPERNFDFWLRHNGNFLPSPQARWCTIKLKLQPFKNWVNEWLKKGDKVISYVAIRSDEEHREGMQSHHKNLTVKLPFREKGLDKEAVLDILEASGIGLPKYYEWRSRSGCTFCFFQQKIEWVRLKERHPEAFEHAKSLEKTALETGTRFTWSQNEPLTELEKPERIEQIKRDFEERKKRELANRKINPLRINNSENLDLDELYMEDEGGGACLVCHK
jgi:3'-phosphoadenosine 5'-phosphosulfate sulfotransferase (PAPS reductase)/FAD synthetase